MQLTDEEDLHNAVLHAPIGICILNANSLVAEIVNQKFLEVAGKPYETIFGQFYWDAFAEARPYYEDALANVVKTGEAYYANEVELMLIRHGREERIFVTFVYAPIKDEAGKVKKVAVWVLENTSQVNERQNIEAARVAFKRERDRLKNFFMQAPAGICILDGPDLVYELVNPAYQELLPGRRLLNRPLFEALPELAGTPLQEVLLNVYRTGEPYQMNELLIPIAEYEGGPTTNRYFSFTYQARRDENDQIDGIMAFVFEVTGMIEVQQDLRRARERSDQQTRVYETITSGTPDLIYVFDLNYRFIYANQALLSMWGKTWENAVGKGLLDNGYEPWHAEMHEREIDQVKATKQPIRGEVSFPHAILGRRVYDYIFTPVVNEHGEVEAVAGTTRDITERKLAEQQQVEYTKALQAVNEEIAASNEELVTTNEELMAMQQRLEDTNQELAASASRLGMAIESTSLGTWDYNPQTGELYWSKECRDIYGVPPDIPVTFALFSEHIHPSDRDWVQKEIEKAIDPEKGGRYDISFRIIRFNSDETRWVKVHGSVYFELALATRFIGTVLDITDMKEAEKQSARLAAIIQSSDDAIISKTLDSVITSWNAAAERIFGYPAEEMVGESIYKLIPEDRLDEEPQILARLKSGERVQHFETKRQTKDGRLIDVSLTISPVKDPQGNIIGLSKIARDITEKKLDETRKSDFIGMVSHELKTPLTSLGAIIQVANAKLGNSADSFLVGAMQKANQQVKRMTAMINGFLNISRLESGKIHIEKQNFDMETLIADVIEEANLTTSTHIINYNQHQPLLLSADRDKIGSVISNFISNAIKYSPKGKYIDVSCIVRDGEVILSVKDEGMGIKQDDLGKIFDRYYRVETNHTRHISGFGIGLYLSSEIIERHGGKVWAESESGKGSTFYFSLPLATS
ncbi:PAS domain-containing protein [Mucilaginibacter ginsenosidivorax]|uniref:histidine kinase n=1 Tax=Mucilaginibacter ginsenosidivorax TaxID=862126 RepID=A0A5B8W0L5_9SPHI|nr:PAS domain-containing protein [Mucilaginibacter ginsenosidivorax]QEC76435.1 PAS domain S-box protein [Mucilaginibacter ginsenosidivorax]